MTVLSALTALALQLCLPLFASVLTLILFLASFGKSLGIRRLYVRALLRIFEVRCHTPLKRHAMLSLYEWMSFLICRN